MKSSHPTTPPLAYAPDYLRPIIAHRPLRIIGDVHGEYRAFLHATATNKFIIQLGDLVDHGENSIAVVEHMLDLQKNLRGLFIAGNHERKLVRGLKGRQIKADDALKATLEAFSNPRNEKLKTLFIEAVEQAPTWCIIGQNVFVHGGFHPAMLSEPSPLATGKITPLLGRALFGEVVSHKHSDGYPERSLAWVETIPENITVYCGHDQRSVDGMPLTITGKEGGKAIFLDTGAGKGGHLSWIDLPPPS